MGAAFLMLFNDLANTYPSRDKMLNITHSDWKMGEQGIYKTLMINGVDSGTISLRNLLYFPTLSAIQHNDRIKTFYEGLTSRAKTKKLVVIASMRKLILMAFSLFKSEEAYQPLLVKI